jgi:hypothetical protein
MTTAELQKRIDASAALSDLKRKLTDEIALQADNSFQFDPFLVVMIISVLVQVIIHCREQNSDDSTKHARTAYASAP